MPECIRMMDSNAHRKAIGEQIAYASHFLSLSLALFYANISSIYPSHNNIYTTTTSFHVHEYKIYRKYANCHNMQCATKGPGTVRNGNGG